MKVKTPLTMILIIMFAVVTVFAQRGRIVTEALTPHKINSLGLTTNTSSGLNVVANDTYVYLSAKNIGNSDEIISAKFEFISKPSGSTALFEDVNHELCKQIKSD